MLESFGVGSNKGAESADRAVLREVFHKGGVGGVLVNQIVVPTRRYCEITGIWANSSRKTVEIYTHLLVLFTVSPARIAGRPNGIFFLL